jgi:hypothetical protein
MREEDGVDFLVWQLSRAQENQACCDYFYWLCHYMVGSINDKAHEELWEASWYLR